MELKQTTPTTEGWYLVELKLGHIEGDRRYDVDYLAKQGESDGGGMQWAKWYDHNIKACWELP